MATTTNYGWDTPDDTDLVKDGAAAIRTLGSSIDTTTKNLNPETTTGDIAYRSATANTNTRLAIGTTGQILTVAAGVPSWATPAAGGGDVVRITTSSFTTANAASLDSVFSSTYNNYLILLNIEASSGSNAMNLRFKTGGSDNTTSTYGSSWEYTAFGTAGATGNLGSAAGTNLAYISDITGNLVSYAMTVHNPFASFNTYASWMAVMGNGYKVTGGLEFDAATSFDGISFLSAAGTITGTISVYGYKKS